ncbi:MAG: glycosyltransferase family 39 protein [Deltaproteobacteria bacterium]|nr:glycosyltransferase family 39 protein [Deltaproteobacteria bacterium]
MRERWRRSIAARVGVAALLLGAAAVGLLTPGPRQDAVGWTELIAPLRVGEAVTRGYVLLPPRRGTSGDIVCVARRPAGPLGPPAHIELHVLDRGRWPGVLETRSFGVAWEQPPNAADFPQADAVAVTQALADAIARNDPGGLPPVGAIRLPDDAAPPPIVGVLERLRGARAAAVGGAVALALLLLASLPYGAVAAGALLFAIGLGLRGAVLDLPFVRDQDVQRLFTGHLPLSEIAFGGGLRDRHPPLYFFLLHAAQAFGQSEAVGRAPAALAGALVGPALLLATRAAGRRVGALALLAALAATVSPALVAGAREVSEIPLYALLALAAAASLLAALRAPRWPALAVVAAAHALAFWTYYLAPFLVAAHAAVLVWRRAARRVWLAFVVGVIAGLPALGLAALTLVRDRGARDVARAYPSLAWGEHTPLGLLVAMLRLSVEALGWPVALLTFTAAVGGLLRRDAAAITPALGAAATLAGIALLAPVARVQPYYIETVLPLALLGLAVWPVPTAPFWRAAAALGLVAVAAASLAPRLADARALYAPDPDACMPRFAAEIARHPQTRVLTVAHYDKALLAYYLARREGRALDWYQLDQAGGPRIEPLLLVHALDAGSEAAALRRLDEAVADGAVLVVDRDAVSLPALAQRLAACERLVEAPTARLLRCTRQSSGVTP